MQLACKTLACLTLKWDIYVVGWHRFCINVKWIWSRDTKNGRQKIHRSNLQSKFINCIVYAISNSCWSQEICTSCSSERSHEVRWIITIEPTERVSQPWLIFRKKSVSLYQKEVNLVLSIPYSTLLKSGFPRILRN